MVGIVADMDGGADMPDAVSNAISDILRYGGITGLAIMVVLGGGLLIAWKIAGKELKRPPAEHPIDRMHRELKDAIDVQGEATRTHIQHISARTEAAHLRIDALFAIHRNNDR